MTLEITAAARQWLLQKTGVATIRLSPRHGCCGGGAQAAVAEARTPDDPSAYKRIDRDGLVLYLHPALEDQALTLDISGLLGFKTLLVEGSSLTRLRE